MTRTPTGQPGRLYISRIARFHCGCIYRLSSDRLYSCPVHRQVLTGIERLTHPSPDSPLFNRIAPNPYLSRQPHILRNSRRNSDSVRQVANIGGQELDEDNDPIVGICSACYAESSATTITPTEIALCGCPDTDCRYRWCDLTSGLHAFHRMHIAQDYGQLAHPGVNTLRFDRDIFCWGPAQDTPPDWQSTLDQEREWLGRQSERLLTHVLKSSVLPPHQLPLTTRLPWLDRDRPDRLRKQLARLLCMGLIQPAPPTPPAASNSLFQYPEPTGSTPDNRPQ